MRFLNRCPDLFSPSEPFVRIFKLLKDLQEKFSLPILLLCLIMLSGCMGDYHRSEPMDSNSTMRGVASWYGPSFHGKSSASGEPYDMWALTAAHRTLPFGTIVQVDSLETGKTVRVRINDRGPFIRGRIIDLSYAAARELAMIGRGTEEVVLTVLKLPNEQHPGGNGRNRYWVQAGSFQTLSEAVSFQEQLRPHYSRIRLQSVQLPSGEWHRVQIGDFSSAKKARHVAAKLEEQFHIEPLLLQDN